MIVALKNRKFENGVSYEPCEMTDPEEKIFVRLPNWSRFDEENWETYIHLGEDFDPPLWQVLCTGDNGEPRVHTYHDGWTTDSLEVVIPVNIPYVRVKTRAKTLEGLESAFYSQIGTPLDLYFYFYDLAEFMACPFILKQATGFILLKFDSVDFEQSPKF